MAPIFVGTPYYGYVYEDTLPVGGWPLGPGPPSPLPREPWAPALAPPRRAGRGWASGGAGGRLHLLAPPPRWPRLGSGGLTPPAPEKGREERLWGPIAGVWVREGPRLRPAEGGSLEATAGPAFARGSRALGNGAASSGLPSGRTVPDQMRLGRDAPGAPALGPGWGAACPGATAEWWRRAQREGRGPVPLGLPELRVDGAAEARPSGCSHQGAWAGERGPEGGRLRPRPAS